MSTVDHMAKTYEGIYRWTSSKDKDGDTLTIRNTNSSELGLIVTAGNDMKYGVTLLSHEEARELALVLMDFAAGECPRVTPTERESY